MNGFVDGAADEPAVAVVERAEGAGVALLDVLKLNGLASDLAKGLAEGAAEPNENAGLGGEEGAAPFVAEKSKILVVLVSGTGDGVGVGSGIVGAPNTGAGFLGEGGIGGGVAAGVTSAGSEGPKAGLPDGRFKPKGEGFDADVDGGFEPKLKGDGAVSLVVDEPKLNAGLVSTGLGCSGADTTAGLGVGAEVLAFLLSSKSLTILSLCSLYCPKSSPRSQNMSASIARFVDSVNA